MGPAPFSAPEPKAMADFITSREDRVMVFMVQAPLVTIRMYTLTLNSGCILTERAALKTFDGRKKSVPLLWPVRML